MSEALNEAQGFEAFYSAYRDAHARPRTQDVHAVATLSASGLILAGLVSRRPGLVLLAPLLDYAIAQTSHRAIEGNVTRPWRHPRWHVRAELRMCRETLHRWSTTRRDGRRRTKDG